MLFLLLLFYAAAIVVVFVAFVTDASFVVVELLLLVVKTDVAVDFADAATAVTVLGVTLWCCYYYRTANLVVG